MSGNFTDHARSGAVLVFVVAWHGVVVYGLMIGLRRDASRLANNLVAHASTQLLFVVRKIGEEQPPRRAAEHSRASKSTSPAISNVDAPAIATSFSAIDWSTERAITAEASTVNPEHAQRSLRSAPRTIELPPPERESRGIFPVGPRRAGKTQRLDDGELITWIDDECYYTNRPAPGLRLDSNALNKVCKDPSSGRDDLFDHLKPSYLFEPGEQRVLDPRDENVDRLP